MSTCGPLPFDTTDSVLTGMSRQDLQAALTAAQTAYTQLMTGAKVATVSISQDGGSRTVSYTPANVGSLTAFIRLVQAQLGINTMGRRPVRFNF
jgi:hypothetical protein